jgi:hypothetical protein
MAWIFLVDAGNRAPGVQGPRGEAHYGAATSGVQGPRGEAHYGATTSGVQGPRGEAHYGAATSGMQGPRGEAHYAAAGNRAPGVQGPRGEAHYAAAAPGVQGPRGEPQAAGNRCQGTGTRVSREVQSVNTWSRGRRDHSRAHGSQQQQLHHGAPAVRRDASCGHSWPEAEQGGIASPGVKFKGGNIARMQDGIHATQVWPCLPSYSRFDVLGLLRMSCGASPAKFRGWTPHCLYVLPTPCKISICLGLVCALAAMCCCLIG